MRLRVGEAGVTNRWVVSLISPESRCFQRRRQISRRPRRRIRPIPGDATECSLPCHTADSPTQFVVNGAAWRGEGWDWLHAAGGHEHYLEAGRCSRWTLGSSLAERCCRAATSGIPNLNKCRLANAGCAQAQHLCEFLWILRHFLGRVWGIITAGQGETEGGMGSHILILCCVASLSLSAHRAAAFCPGAFPLARGKRVTCRAHATLYAGPRASAAPSAPSQPKGGSGAGGGMAWSRYDHEEIGEYFRSHPGDALSRAAKLAGFAGSVGLNIALAALAGKRGAELLEGDVSRCISDVLAEAGPTFSKFGQVGAPFLSLLDTFFEN